VYKKVVLLTLNVVNFYNLFAKDYIPREKGILDNLTHVLDKWIVSKLHVLVEEVTKDMESYDIARAASKIQQFVDELSTWYIRRSRDRFKASDENAVITLGHVLLNLSKIMAPLVPFLGEYVYQGIKGKKESVHMEDWPDPKWYLAYKDVLDDMEEIRHIMDKARQIIVAGHSLRDEAGYKVRQPLKALQIQQSSFELRKSRFYKELIPIMQDELNIHSIEFVEHLPDDGKDGWVVKDPIALDTRIDAALREEGIIRELTRQINSLRKKQGLTITDRVTVQWSTTSASLASIITAHKEELQKSVLAKEIISREALEGEKVTIEGDAVFIILVP
jgi:isoleucyl-tRNA synthetase